MSERRRPGALGALGALALGLALGGCTTMDNLVAKVPWFTSMRDQRVVRPFEAPSGARTPRAPAPGSVPVTGHEDSLDLLTDLASVTNPVAPTVESLRRGKQIYEQYCVVCHGPTGHSDGTVVPKFVPPPDITMPATQQRSDGYLYAVLRQGRGIMPRYGDKIRGRDRWSVVNYVRRLQGMR